MIFALIPIICWFLLALILLKRGLCWRRSFLSASVVWGVMLTVMTESLSILKLLTFSWLLVCWGLATLISFLVYYSTPENTLKTDVKAPLFLKMLIVCVAIIAIITCIIASVSPPNNWDSMTYHMSRVVHWIQNRSVEHYPTHILRQLESNPWAEFTIMNLVILSGQDYLVNLVQWFSMMGSIIGTTLIAKQCGVNLRGQIFTAVIVATIPMGILQSSSTQNDYVVAFWLVCFVYFCILCKEKENYYNLMAVGASFGLAILTKATAYIYAFPFLLWFFIVGVKFFRWKVVTQILLISFIIVSLNVGHYWRNYELFGNPLTSGAHKYSNEIFSVPALISNISRNIALHIGTPSDSINSLSMSIMIRMHSLLKVDLSEPKTTWPGSIFMIKKTNTHEDTAGNPLHFILMMLSATIVLFYKEFRQMPNLLSYLFAIITAFLLFSFYLKWQPWGSRLHLPLFVLSSVVIAAVMCNEKYRWPANNAMIVLILASLSSVLCNSSRPFIDCDTQKSIFTSRRYDQYFVNRPDLKESYLSTADFLNMQKCRNIAVTMGENDWEYPLWVFVRKMGDPIPRIEHVQVANRSGKIPLVNFAPCILLHSGTDSKLSFSRDTSNPFHQEINSSSPLRTLKVGEVATMPVMIKNSSYETWPHTGIDEKGTNRVGLGFNWIDGTGKEIQEGRTPLPNDLPPRSSITLEVKVQAPSQPGNYSLRFSMVKEHVAWFYNKGADSFVVPVLVKLK